MNRFTNLMEKQVRRELDELRDRISRLRSEDARAELDSGGDNTPLTETVDAIQAGEEKNVRSELLARLDERAQSLEAALERMGSGEYGVCSNCDQPISQQRLAAMPEAVLCLRCQAQSEEVALESARPGAA